MRQKILRTIIVIYFGCFAFWLSGQTAGIRDSSAHRLSQTLQGTWQHANTCSSEKNSDNIQTIFYFDTLVLKKDGSFLLKGFGSPLAGTWHIKSYYNRTARTPNKYRLVLLPSGGHSNNKSPKYIFPQLKEKNTFLNDVSELYTKEKRTVIEYYYRIK